MPYFYPAVQVRRIGKPFPCQTEQRRQKHYLCSHPSCVLFGKLSNIAFSSFFHPFSFSTLCFSNFEVFLQVANLPVPISPALSVFPWLRGGGCRGLAGARGCMGGAGGAYQYHHHHPGLVVTCKKFNWKLSGFFWSELCASGLILQEQEFWLQGEKRDGLNKSVWWFSTGADFCAESLAHFCSIDWNQDYNGMLLPDRASVQTRNSTNCSAGVCVVLQQPFETKELWHIVCHCLHRNSAWNWSHKAATLSLRFPPRSTPGKWVCDFVQCTEYLVSSQNVLSTSCTGSHVIISLP